MSAPALLDALAGRPAGDLLELIEQVRISCRDRLTLDFVAARPDIGRRLAELPAPARDRLLDAPAWWSAMFDRADGVDVDGYIHGWLDAEERLCAASAGAGPQWTALGDVCVGTDHVAPRTPLGAWIDGSSPGALDPQPEISGQAAPFSPEERANAVTKVLAGEQLLKSSGEARGRLVQAGTAVIVVRNDPSTDDFNSASSRRAVRRPVLRNPHLDRATPAVVADALLHEAVHALLDVGEMVSPFTTGDARCRSALLRSPWSGRRLDVGTFVHACLVWYALVHLWLDALRSGVADEPTIVELLTRRARGFVGGPLVNQLEPHAQLVTPGTFDLVQAAQDEILNALNG